MANEQLNRHTFNFELPLCPHQNVDGQTNLKLEMDGKPLKGVTGLTLRAGTDGFTNVVMEFETAAMAKFTGHLVANMNIGTSEKNALRLAEIYQSVKSEIEQDLENDGSELDCDIMGQAQFVKRIIEKTMETF